MSGHSSSNKPSADFTNFKNFMSRLVAVPHAEIKARIEAEKKTKRRPKKHAASRNSASS
jgi:hypothetical protein